MSLIAMPLVVANLGAEMLYILDQRLKAQCIADDKASKVLDDVVKGWVDNRFIEELFKPQEVYSLASTRLVMERLAHSSIMRLSPTSMDKLYDLMVMGVKYQLLCCRKAQELLQVTVTHLHTVKALVTDPSIVDSMDLVEARVLSLYESLPYGQWALLRQTLCRFFQDRRVKVSLFLQEGIQTPAGRIILPQPVSDGSTPAVGTVHRFNSDGRLAEESSLEVAAVQGEPADFFQHPSALGANLYDRDRQKASPPAGRHSDPASTATPASEPAAASSAPPAQIIPDLLASANGTSAAQPAPPEAAAGRSGVRELNLLASLVKPHSTQASNFKLTLFDDEPSTSAASPLKASPAKAETQTFGRAGKNEEYLHNEASGLASVIEGISLAPAGKGTLSAGDESDSLLDLMDSVS
ncbi:hypothetical protein WJX72_003504 [[Myrmecia] bisecta]|uniref:Uncharacterized protein n=1 Tax=[Myrmecia] bisecta TaxID=41462 RepID=A0AAW1PD37_9CHLO